MQDLNAPLFGLPDRNGLSDPEGRNYRTFRGGLTPRYHSVWLQIGAAYGVLATALIALAALKAASVPVLLLATIAAAAVIGYTVAFIALFIHESAHFNVASTRELNDRLANIFIGSLIGMDAKRYRRVHMQHHKLLGTPEDPERSYFSALNLRFIVEALTGIRVLRVLLSYQTQLDRLEKGEARASIITPTLLAGIAAHGLLLAFCLWAGLWHVAVAWVVGVGVVFPFFASLRQLLEHRSLDANAVTDYSRVAQGETHRLFGDGFIASTLGGAGFNRHLLHHWDPGVSCTRLRDVEAFLMSTDAAASLRQHGTSYWATLKGLYGR